MNTQSLTGKHAISFMGGVFVVGGLYLSSTYNYLLFHGMIELFCVIVAVGVFMVAWEADRFTKNRFVSYVGIAYLFVGALDALHLFTYKGMGGFPGHGANLPTQFWIAGRYLQSMSIWVAFYLYTRKTDVTPRFAFVIYAIAFSLSVAMIFSGFFPDCYVEGSGLTPFKITSEYLISLILLLSVPMLWGRRHLSGATLIRFLCASVFITIASELAFSFYTDVYGFPNLIGHILKGISYYLIYMAFIKTGIDTPYRMLESAQREWEEIFQAIGHPTFISDKDHTILAANRAALKSAGLIKKMAACRCFEMFHGTDRPPPICLLKKMRDSGNYVPMEAEMDTLGGIYLVSCTPVLDDQGNLRKIIHIATDITERRRAEKALQDAHGKLEKKVAERTTELRKAKDAAEVANKAKGKFIANITHELRTPLNVIFGLSQLMADDLEIPDRQRENINLIHKSGEILKFIVDQILDISKIDGGRAISDQSHFDFQQLLFEVEDSIRLRIGKKRLEFIVIQDSVPLGYIVADKSKLRQVLISLLDNAVKFTETGKIVLRVGSKKTGEIGRKPPRTRLWFEVEDTGPGIPQEDWECIFEAFLQSGGESGKPKGIGLGLPISQKIVRLMGGDIRVNSHVGVGTTFAFDIPIFSSGPFAGECPIPQLTSDFPAMPPSRRKEAPGRLAGLPFDLLAEIEKDVIEGDRRRALRHIDEIRGLDSKMADTLGEMVKNFEYRALLALIRESRVGDDTGMSKDLRKSGVEK